MEAYVKLLQSDAEDICNAIRDKTSEPGTLTASEAAAAIEGLSNISASVTGTTLNLTGPVSVSGGVLNL